MTSSSRPLAVLLVLVAALPVVVQPRPLVVTLKFVPQENVYVAGTALPPSVIDRSVEQLPRVEDSRNLADAATIGEGTDDDDRPFPIRASSDVVPFVSTTVTGLATSRALKIASPADRQLRLRLTRFNVNETNKAVGSTYSAEVQFAFVIADGDGRALAEGARRAPRTGMAALGVERICTEVLSDALKEAFMKVLADTTLQSAWGSGIPSASIAAPAGQETMEMRLRRVDDLLKKGLITPEEHKILREQILKNP